MAHKKAGGTVGNLTDSPGQRLGVKRFGGQVVLAGEIIIRQRGTNVCAGQNVMVSKDHTLHATIDGEVRFSEKRITNYNGSRVRRKFVNIDPIK